MEGGAWTQLNKVDYSVVCQYTDVCMVYSCNSIYNKNKNFLTEKYNLCCSFERNTFKFKWQYITVFNSTKAGISLHLQLYIITLKIVSIHWKQQQKVSIPVKQKIFILITHTITGMKHANICTLRCSRVIYFAPSNYVHTPPSISLTVFTST